MSRRTAATKARFVVVRGSGAHRLTKLGVFALAAALCVGLALVMPDYRLLLFGRVLAFVVAIAGLNIVSGLSGQLSLGHSAFMGVGAYTSAILIADHGWPWLATLAPSVVFGLIAGLLLGLPAMRVRGLYLALVTLSVGVLFPTLVKRFQGLTGGANGKTVVTGWTTPSWVPFELGSAGWRLLVLFAVAAVAFWAASTLVSSPAGRALVALRDHEIASTTCGINLRRYRLGALAVSAALGAVAGSMLTLIVPVVSPEAFGFALAVELITGLVVGGMTRLSGAVLGALLVVWLPYYAAGWSGHLPIFSGSDAGVLANAIYGIVLIVIVFTLPGGLASGVDKLVRRIVAVVPFRPASLGHTSATGRGVTTAPPPDTQPRLEEAHP